MHKLRLQLDDLRVDSFNTTAGETENGTVFGEQCTCHTACTCPGCPTCWVSCDGNCNEWTKAFTCNGYGCTAEGGECVG
ncbi:MAG TPA: hypothetical protein VHG08_13190 [Longimicrobium sp.]|nr:hypothetical protein [Longimicrobium sp.]